MTGLDLESFLLLLRADLTTWMVLGLATIGLALLVWSSWRSRRALRNCLVLSLAAHLGLVVFGSTIPAVMWTVGSDRRSAPDRPHVRQIRVAALRATGDASGDLRLKESGGIRRPTDRWDAASAPLPLADAPLQSARAKFSEILMPLRESNITPPPSAPVPAAAPISKVRLGAPPEARLELTANETGGAPAPPIASAPSLPELDRAGLDVPPSSTEQDRTRGKLSQESSLSNDPALAADRRLRPGRIGTSGPTVERIDSPIGGASARRERTTIRGDAGASTHKATKPEENSAERRNDLAEIAAAIPLDRATPNSRKLDKTASGLAPLGDRAGGQNLVEIPKIYQPRLEPDRSTKAKQIGASTASELAVERALDWLSRHQDDDGRWDAGIARYDDGTAVKDDNDFTVHCPPGEKCVGECAYWEADTALTGLALLTFLGAGYTHTDGRYSEVVSRGLDFLTTQQKPDGDLRGRSEVVGMYCHAMATLALCEAFALTGDKRLREPVERAVVFLVRARARDGMAWRYAPGAPAGDTSILGWVVMGLKSAKEVGIPIPGEPAVRRGTLLWLEKVATGSSKGLARYQPWESVTPTMTAEAWVCRQFLGVGGPGPSSAEAAEFLLRNASDRGETNFYYWYYATLALYQHGGEPWTRWNAKIRDKIVGLQAVSGHQTGSWEPDTSPYGAKGGRIYCTALAALSLEVYYRYLRLYDAPKIPMEAGANPDRRAQ